MVALWGRERSGEAVENWVDRDGADLASKLAWNRLGQVSRKYPSLEGGPHTPLGMSSKQFTTGG